MKRRSLHSLLATMALLVGLTALVPSTAAATTTPAAGYEQFTGCPHPGQNPLIATCYRSVVSGGELQMGNQAIPISTPITLSGGITGAGKFDFNSFGGLLPAKQVVPGGVIGFTGLTWLTEYLSIEALALYAVIELAGTPGEPLTAPASLPVKVHFLNSVLGKNCYVGSNAEPIELQLTTGTTKPPPPNSPIEGAPGETSTTSPSGITDIAEGTNVDNSFYAPGANGCVLTLFGYPAEKIDSTINAQSGLPSAAGSNTTIQDFDTEHVPAEIVYP